MGMRSVQYGVSKAPDCWAWEQLAFDMRARAYQLASSPTHLDEAREALALVSLRAYTGLGMEFGCVFSFRGISPSSVPVWHPSNIPRMLWAFMSIFFSEWNLHENGSTVFCFYCNLLLCNEVNGFHF